MRPPRPSLTRRFTRLYGLDLDYLVMASNGDTTASSAPVAFRLGDTIPVFWNSSVRPIVNPVREEIYVLEQSSDMVKAVTKAHVVDRSYQATLPRAMALSQDGTRLYVFGSGSPPLGRVLDPATFNVIGSYALPRLPWRVLVAGRPGRLYAPIYTGGISVLDDWTGVEVAQIPLSADALAMAPDGNTLFALDHPVGARPVVYRIDVSTDSAVILAQRTIDDERTDVSDLQIDPTGQRLYLTLSPFSNYVNVWDATTLESLDRITPAGGLWYFVASSDAAWLSEGVVSPSGGPASGRVVRYRHSDAAVLGSWEIIYPLQGVVPSGDGAAFYAFGNGITWIVPVN